MSTRVADFACRLKAAVARPPGPERLPAALDAIGAGGLVAIKPPKRGAEVLDAILIRPDGREVTRGGDMPARTDGCGVSRPWR